MHIDFRTTENEGLWWYLDGSDIRQINGPSYDFFFQTSACSPDGSKIAHMSLEEQIEYNECASLIHGGDINGK